jgi:hypothetical protein
MPIVRSTLLRCAFAAGLIAVGLAGCGSMRPSQKIDIWEASLTGGEEVPPVSTAGNGMAEVQFNTNTNVISWKVTYSGLSGPATASHIHGPAEVGQNAGVVVPFANVGMQPIQGQATLTPAQVADLVAGRWYVNVHTAAHPGGEIRGQLRRRQ